MPRRARAGTRSQRGQPRLPRITAGDCGNRDLTRWKPDSVKPEHWQLRFRARDHHDLLGRRPAVAAPAAAGRPGCPASYARCRQHGTRTGLPPPPPARGRPGPGTGTGTCQCRGYLGSPPEATSLIAAAASHELKLRLPRTWRLTAGLRVHWQIQVTTRSQSPWPGGRADCRRHGPQLRQSGLGLGLGDS